MSVIRRSDEPTPCLHWHVERYGTAYEPATEARCVECDERFVVASPATRGAVSAVEEAVAIMRDARGHYGIEETGGPGQPATEWDEIADRMQMFVLRWGQ